MTTDPNETAGTLPPDDGDGAEITPPTGTQEADDRNARGRPGITHAEAMEWKAKAEAYNKLQAQLAEQAKESPPVTPNADKRGVWDKVADYAQQEDPVAEGLQQLVSDLIIDRQLNKIPDEALRDRVSKHFLSNRHRLGDVDAAKAEVLSKDQEAELTRLRDELKKLSREPDPDAVKGVPTHKVDVTSADMKARKISRDAWEAEQKALEWSDPKKFRENQRAVREKKLIIQG